MSIFDLRGPEFLQLYLVLLLGALLIAFITRLILRGISVDYAALDRAYLDAFEIAYLAGGPRVAIYAAVGSLMHRGMLKLEVDDSLSANVLPRTGPLSALEKNIYDAVSKRGSANIDDIRWLADACADAMRRKLIQMNLIRLPLMELRARLFSGMIAAAPLLIGIPKIIVGVSRGRPVDILVILCVITVAIAVGFIVTPSRVTATGKRLLANLKEHRVALKEAAGRPRAVLAPEDLALAIALFGPRVLTGGDHARLGQVLQPVSQGDSSSAYYDSGGGGGGGGGCGGCGS